MSAIRLLVLGAIKRRTVAHGYRIRQDFREWRVDTWTTVQPGSIYHALSQMESQGLLIPKQESSLKKLGPSKTAYKLTSSGEREFLQQLELALKSLDVVQFSVGIAFMEFLPRKEVTTLLQERKRALLEVPLFLRTLPTEDRPSTPARHPELMRVWSDHFTDAAATTQMMINAIQSGKYVFNNEEIV